MISLEKDVQPNTQPTIDDLIKALYQHGFVTVIESNTFPPGLSEDIIQKISTIKNEPKLVLDWRLKS